MSNLKIARLTEQFPSCPLRQIEREFGQMRRFSFCKLLKPACLKAFIIGLLPAGMAMAENCAALAAPVHTKDYGVWWAELDAEKALEVCTAELQQDPENAANVAHLARVYSKLGQQDVGLAMLQALGPTNDPDAATYLGVLLEDTDFAQAIALYETAAATGHLYAINRLSAALLKQGTGFQDTQRALDLRRNNALAGSTLDALNWGKDLMYGRNGIAADPAGALAFLHLAAEGRNTGAYAELGRAYRWAKGTAEDLPKAIYWFEKGMAADNSYSMEQLAYLARDGKGMTEDKDRASALFTRAGERGRASAWHALGRMLNAEGRDSEAVGAWRKAATARHTAAYERLGWAYYFGYGVPKDIEEGVRLTLIAADKGDVYAKERLAEYYRYGVVVAQDQAKAHALYKASAEAGLQHAAFRLARAYEDGLGVPKDPAKAIELFEKAAEIGSNSAEFALGVAYTRGEGVEKSIETAAEIYRKMIVTGQGNVTLAQSNLAELYAVEGVDGRAPDLLLAEALYRQAARKDWHRAMRKLADILIDQATPQAVKEAAELYTKAGAKGDQKARSRLEQAFADPNDPLHAPLTQPTPPMKDAFVTIGRDYEEVWASCLVLFGDCGTASVRKLDLTYAAEWYRRALDAPDAQFRLGALLLAQPQVPQQANEAETALQIAAATGNPDAALFLTVFQADPDKLSEIFVSALSALTPEDASRIALFALKGRFGDAAIGPAWTWLETQARAGDNAAQITLVAASLFLGAFDLAAEELRRLPAGTALDLSDVDYTLDQTLTFWMGAVRDGVTPDPAQMEAMQTLLDALAGHNPEATAPLELKLDEVRYRLATRDSFEPLRLQTDVSIDARLARLDERRDTLMQGRGLSPVLVPLYREYAKVQAEAGQLEDAEASIYRSVSIAQSINEQSRHLHGSLIYHMEMACHKRKASDVLFELGIDTAALALAKSAVNHLQSARSTVVGLPQNLQNCFRDVLADQYRRMADLLIRNGYLDEAQSVLAQLKDVESFRYAGNAPDRLGAAFDPVAMSEAQSDIITRIHGLPIKELIALEQKKAALSAEDDAALEALEADLETARLALADSLDDLSDSVRDLDTDASQDLARDLSARQLRRLAGRLERLDSVAMVYSVSLPERTHFLIVTADGTEHHELALDEVTLNEHIQAARRALSTPSLDPEPAARKLYEDVWAPVDAALAPLGADGQVLLVLDGQLRYVPIPALLGPDGWLVTGHQYVTFTPASRDLLLDDEVIDTLEVEALGASRGGSGFTPLPFVKDELASIVGLASQDNAIVTGRARLDDRFDADSFSDALNSGAPVIHVATHFDLTETEDSSRLLLGTGETLSVANIKEGARAGRFDLNDVHMLVLSACSTGFSGGSELESLATEMQYEGVRTVLATLWPVSDQSTAAFMAAFYSELQAGGGRSDSLHAVQRQFVQNKSAAALNATLRGGFSLTENAEPEAVYHGYSHPFYWAGFQMIGQWR